MSNMEIKLENILSFLAKSFLLVLLGLEKDDNRSDGPFLHGQLKIPNHGSFLPEPRLFMKNISFSPKINSLLQFYFKTLNAYSFNYFNNRHQS